MRGCYAILLALLLQAGCAETQPVGPKSDFALPWNREPVTAGKSCKPVAAGGFQSRVLHLVHEGERDVGFLVEIDVDGKGGWTRYRYITVPAGKYRYCLFPPELKAERIRITADRDCVATACLELFSPGQYSPSDDRRLFSSLADAYDQSCAGGLLLPSKDNLLFLRREAGQDGKIRETFYEIDGKMRLIRPEQDHSAVVRAKAGVTKEFSTDAASVIVTGDGKRYRLPMGGGMFDRPFATGWPRGSRETPDGLLMNIHGTFYLRPPGAGMEKIRPVSSHNLQITDFCSWQGMMVLCGTRADEEKPWIGSPDRLWRLGKPRGRGGPWRDTEVRAGQASDPYLMAGYDRKKLILSHDSPGAVSFTIEVNFDLARWHILKKLNVPPEKTLVHRFPDGYSAHWVRLKAGKDCRSTALFIYE